MYSRRPSCFADRLFAAQYTIAPGASGATRGYHSDYDDQSRHWEDSKPSVPTKDNEGATEVASEAEVEVVENRDRNHGRAATGNARSATPASTTWDSTMALATEKDAARSRLGELHRLLNNRKGSLSANYRKNAEANDRAYDMNQKTLQALDILAKEYGSFEATMKKVTFEHEEGDVLYAMASEVADELDRAQKDQDRLQDELDCSCEDLAGILELLGHTRSSEYKTVQRFLGRQ